MKSYIEFVEVEKKPKTSVYEIRARSGGRLGIIKWNGPWRRYCFLPDGETIWSSGCMQEVQDFIDNLMRSRRSTK